MSNHNPSRKNCEDEIRRILMKETLEYGKNMHFRSAMDFMKYFEALYPPSQSLIKQVQRAIKSMDIPKDKDGFFLIDKTKSQMAHDAEISNIFAKSSAVISKLDEYETVFVELAPDYKSYLLRLIDESVTLQGKYITVVDSLNGLIFYTDKKEALLRQLEALIDQ